jgi:hypothetical protein
MSRLLVKASVLSQKFVYSRVHHRPLCGSTS